MTRKQFFAYANHHWLMRFYMLLRLPMAWFAGIGVVRCSQQETVVRLPYGWRSQNPFRSVYFAAQCAAAEMSTGLMALGYLQELPPVSMLVTNIDASFQKKAAGTLLFTCADGEAIARAIDQALASETAQTFVATATGRLADGTVAAVIKITWSFKAKSA